MHNLHTIGPLIIILVPEDSNISMHVHSYFVSQSSETNKTKSLARSVTHCKNATHYTSVFIRLMILELGNTLLLTSCSLETVKEAVAVWLVEFSCVTVARPLTEAVVDHIWVQSTIATIHGIVDMCSAPLTYNTQKEQRKLATRSQTI